MYRKYKDLTPSVLGVGVSNSAEVAEYPEYNLPHLEVVNIDDNSCTSTVIVNEIYDLFNAQRLSGFDNDVINSIRNNILQSSQYTEAISKLSDDEIIESIKPRNIQSPSQLVAWSKYIQSVIEERLQTVVNSKSESITETPNEPTTPQVEPTA